MRARLKGLEIKAAIYPEADGKYSLRFNEPLVEWEGFSLDMASGMLTSPTGDQLDMTADAIQFPFGRIQLMEKLLRQGGGSVGSTFRSDYRPTVRDFIERAGKQLRTDSMTNQTWIV